MARVALSLEFPAVSFCLQLKTFVPKQEFEKAPSLHLDRQVGAFERKVCDTLELVLELFLLLPFPPIVIGIVSTDLPETVSCHCLYLFPLELFEEFARPRVLPRSGREPRFRNELLVLK